MSPVGLRWLFRRQDLEIRGVLFEKELYIDISLENLGLEIVWYLVDVKLVSWIK